MYAIVGFVFCLLLGLMISTQGIAALLWVPLGFVFGIFATAQIVLPILMGLPRAIRLVAKGQMRAAVFGRILVAPLIWLVGLFVVLFVFGSLWPSAAESLYNNAALNLALWLGTLAIFLSPLSKKSRSDFREDFDNNYGRYYTQSAVSPLSGSSRKPTQQKYLEAAVTVATNLYLHTIPEAEDAPAPLQFSLPDSRPRYMCLDAANLVATKDAQEYLGGPASSQDSVENASAYLREFLKHWSRWPELEKEGRNAEIIDLISSMIHTTESNLPAENSDMQRLSELALWIDCRLPTMRGAFIELANR